MAKTPSDLLPALAREWQRISKWVDQREKLIDKSLAEHSWQQTDDPDYIRISVLALSAAERADPSDHILQEALARLELRYRVAGWDEATVDTSSGMLHLKRFRRHVFVTIQRWTNECRAPVFETETYAQAARRILTDGFKHGNVGLDGGLLMINPAHIEYVRIPTY